MSNLELSIVIGLSVVLILLVCRRWYRTQSYVTINNKPIRGPLGMIISAFGLFIGLSVGAFVLALVGMILIGVPILLLLIVTCIFIAVVLFLVLLPAIIFSCIMYGVGRKTISTFTNK